MFFKTLAFFPILDYNNKINWIKNELYKNQELEIKKPRLYNEFGIEKGIPIYEQYLKNREKFMFVADPVLKQKEWKNFIP